MFKNYVKIAFRNLKKHRGFSFINISGLAIGMACCLLIFIYVMDELSYDNHHQKGERIHRMLSFSTIGGTTRRFARSPAALAPAAAESIPEIELYSRVYQFGTAMFTLGDRNFNIPEFYAVDEDYFDLFTHRFISGDPHTALQDPNTLVLTQDTAEMIFGEEDAYGQILAIGEGDQRQEFKVTGVIKNVPKNSHFRFNLLLSLNTFRRDPGDESGARIAPSNLLDEAYFFQPYSYVLLSESADIPVVENKIISVVEEKWGDMLRQRGVVRQYPLQALRDIHLRSDYESDLGNPGNITYVYLFAAIALFVLFIACFNFINLSTARSTLRAKEVGLRKVFGAFRKQLVRQFLSESVLISLIGMALGVCLVSLILPVFNTLTGKEFSQAQLFSALSLGGLLCIIILTGIFAGSFPAFVLSSFKPVDTVRGKLGSSTKSGTLRKALVIVQFSISIFMILSILVIVKQIDFLKNKELGFNKDMMVVLPVGGDQSDSLGERILQIPNIKAVSFSLSIPGQRTGDDTYLPEGKSSEETIRVSAFNVGFDFMRTYDIDIVWGRDFSREFSTDAQEAVLINETAAREMGWGADAVGKEIVNVSRGDMPRKIIGVVRDFHHKSLKQEINPTVIALNPDTFNYISARIHPINIQSTLKHLEGIWNEIRPRLEYNYFFIDDDFRSKYPEEERVRTLYVYFGIIAVFIACLGLFGLASFVIERRTKEIGIRKVLGAGACRIVLSLSSQFMLWVIAANVVAWPMAYIILNKWLQSFAYRITLQMWMFIVCGGLALIVAFLTVIYQAFRSAIANPADALRWE
ncbi:ABC transporter permease [Acidobacteriota bacterium]